MFKYKMNKTDYVFFLKSGSSLLKSVLINLFSNHTIEYSHSYTISLDDERFKQKQKYIFVRNPIDRFFSGYYFSNRNKEMGIDEYIQNYNRICKEENDPHLLSQFRCLSTEESIESYFNNEFGNYKIVKIEDVDKEVENFMKNKSESKNIYNEKIDFDFLNSENSEISIDFILLYTYFKTYYEKEWKMHHKKINFLPEIDKHQYSEVYKLFKDEMLFYGYEKHDHRKFKKALL